MGRQLLAPHTGCPSRRRYVVVEEEGVPVLEDPPLVRHLLARKTAISKEVVPVLYHLASHVARDSFRTANRALVGDLDTRFLGEGDPESRRDFPDGRRQASRESLVRLHE